MAPMFSVRGIGDLATSVAMGFLYDRFEGWTYKLLCVTFGWAVWGMWGGQYLGNVGWAVIRVCMVGSI